jgi:hypothetical protein
VQAEEIRMPDKVAAFAGTLTEFYDRYLVPQNFAPYAEVVADRVNGMRPYRVLETAAATGLSAIGGASARTTLYSASHAGQRDWSVAVSGMGAE